jgi:hypothetical protein
VFTEDELKAEGFTGFQPLLTFDTSSLPRTGGVYVVLRESSDAPTYLAVSPAGHFKDRDPTVSLEVLTGKWIHACAVVYIGKATSLRTRLSQYQQFGQGKPVGHWGGRYLWQLTDAASLIVCWRETPGETPGKVEDAMLGRFIEKYGRLPFANIRN